MTTIHYLAREQEENAVLPTIIEHLEQQGTIAFQAYNITKADKVDYLLILEPIYLDLPSYNRKNYYSISKIWKRFFYGNGWKDSRILVAGYGKTTHPNYINLLQLPENFSPNSYPTIEKHSIHEHRAKNTVSYSDEWDTLMPSRRLDLLLNLENFFDGHDNRGLKIQLNALRQSIAGAHFHLEGGKDYAEVKNKWIIPYINNEWKTLYERWGRYYPLFEVTPFCQKMQAIDESLKKINTMMQNDPITTKNFSYMKHELAQINDIFDNEMERFIRLDLILQEENHNNHAQTKTKHPSS